jgi:rhodanese-related sulfurtransferase
MSDDEYAGDLSPTETWELMQDDTRAVLIDVRTDAEFAYVGGPDPKAFKNPLVKISWILFPGMDRNPHFEDSVRDAVPDKDTPVLFLCRSGQRSAAAARAMTALGYTRCYNIAEGFEGDKNADGHRATVNGWKVRGLPWVQG